MSHKPSTHPTPLPPGPPPGGEEERLDRAIRRADDLLIGSLKKEDRNRQRWRHIAVVAAACLVLILIAMLVRSQVGSLRPTTRWERGHYLVFLQLAEQVGSAPEVRDRWDEMLDAEAEVIAAQPPGPRMHSGVAE